MSDEEQAAFGLGELAMPLNPDCRDGKHAACNEDAWDFVHDCYALCCCSCHDHDGLWP